MRNPIKYFCFLVLPVIVACDQRTSVQPHAVALPEPSSDGAKILKEYCSACHGYPSPGLHVSGEWRHVVQRMQQHRIKKAYDAINQQDIDTLIAYLDKYSRKD